MSLDQSFSHERLSALLALDRPDVEWRHDCDYRLDCAAAMAEWEALAGVRSTYYIRLRGDHYNVFERESRQHITEIIECGHRLGLHVDLHLPREARVSSAFLASAAQLDWRILIREFPMAMSKAVTFHAPPLDVLWREISGFEHGMGPEWYGRYLADSRGVWRDSPEDRLAEGGALQCNLHPEWYFMPEPDVSALRAREKVAP